MPPPSLSFVVPGDLARLTGGYGYDRQIIAGLRQRGWNVDLIQLGEGFPWPDAATRRHAAAQIAAIPEGSTVVVDGLAFGALPELAALHAARLRWVALVHHPLALESGLQEGQRLQIFESERRALAHAGTVIVTSAATARALADYGVPAPRLRVVVPGTAAAALAGGSAAGQAGLSLLCVAALIPRKGHELLVDALAGLKDRRWTLHCVGSTRRDPATTARVRAAITGHGLEARVALHGEVDTEALQAFYDRADVFALPSLHEGYGMALAEALARGLPVVSTTAGAIADTVPPAAGLLVPPGDGLALRRALARVLDEPALRERLATGARAARQQLPSWAQAVERFASALRSAS